VTVIHTTIGGGLDDMTSAEDFHLISWKNFFGLGAVAIGVMIPVGLRYWFRREEEVVEEYVNECGDEEEGVNVKDYDEEDDGDIILEAGPSIANRHVK